MWWTGLDTAKFVFITSNVMLSTPLIRQVITLSYFIDQDLSNENIKAVPAQKKCFEDCGQA
jgi:hypothetical protein